MFDNETYLMITIFQNIFQLDGMEASDPAKYLKLYESEIKDAGPVLEYLGLAKQDQKSHLGWRPTSLLMEIFARRLSRQKRQREPADDELTGHLLFDAVFGEDEQHVQKGYLAYSLLQVASFWETTLAVGARPRSCRGSLVMATIAGMCTGLSNGTGARPDTPSHCFREPTS